MAASSLNRGPARLLLAVTAVGVGLVTVALVLHSGPPPSLSHVSISPGHSDGLNTPTRSSRTLQNIGRCNCFTCSGVPCDALSINESSAASMTCDNTSSCPPASIYFGNCSSGCYNDCADGVNAVCAAVILPPPEPWDGGLDQHVLCERFGFVAQPYWVIFFKIVCNQVVFTSMGKSDLLHFGEKPSWFKLCYVSYQIITAWISFGMIYHQVTDYEGLTGWERYNYMGYLFATSTGMISIIQMIAQISTLVIIQMFSGAEINPKHIPYLTSSAGAGRGASTGVDSDGLLTEGDYRSYDDKQDEEAEEASALIKTFELVKRHCSQQVEYGPNNGHFYLIVGLVGLIPMIPFIITHMSPTLVAFIWVFIPMEMCFLGMAFSFSQLSNADVHMNVRTYFAPFMVNVVATAGLLYGIAALLETAVWLYGYSQEYHPITGHQYQILIFKWFTTHHTEGWVDCIFKGMENDGQRIISVFAFF